MFINLRDVLIEATSHLFFGVGFAESATTIKGAGATLSNMSDTELAGVWDEFKSVNVDMGSGILNGLLWVAKYFWFILGAGKVAAEPLFYKLQVREWEKKRGHLPHDDIFSELYRNSQIDSARWFTHLEKLGMDGDDFILYTDAASLKLNFSEWLYGFRKTNGREPTDTELQTRWHFSVDTENEFLQSFTPLLPIEYAAHWILRYVTPQIIESVPDTFEGLGPLEFTNYYKTLLSPLLASYGYPESYTDVFMDSLTTWANPSNIVRAGLMWQQSEGWIINELIRAGVNPQAAWLESEAARYVPSPFDLALVMRRWGHTEAEISDKLYRLAVHPLYLDEVLEATRYFPSVQDLITMAVREVFTPEVAERFGQFDDLPPEFITNAQRAGLSPDIARWYWAAHWSLPSPMQGYEMLHRGIIDYDDLAKLLRALDIMPFWRDKLIQMSYIVPGRIDTRRMYYLGIYTPYDVYDNYMRLGYSETDAMKLTEFTIADTLASQTGFRPPDVFRAYSKGLIDYSTAYDMLSVMGLDGDHIQIALQRAELDGYLEYVEDQIKLEKELYSRSLKSRPESYSALMKLGVVSTKVNTLLEQWEAQKIAKVALRRRAAYGSKRMRHQEITKAYAYNIMEKEDALERLMDWGYTTEDAEFLLDLAKRTQSYGNGTKQNAEDSKE